MKDAEELDLEERLFGTKKRRIGDGSGANDLSYLVAEDAGAGVGMDGMDDGELFMVDAPTLGGVDGEEYEVGSDVSVDEDDEDGAGAGAGAEVGEEDEIDYEADSADSDSNDEDEASSDSDDSDDSDGESDGASDVDIQLPADQYDYAEHQKKEEERKALDRKCVWSDPADETIGVDLSDVRRLKKLARGKREGEGKVGGRLLAARLREQYVPSFILRGIRVPIQHGSQVKKRGRRVRDSKTGSWLPGPGKRGTNLGGADMTSNSTTVLEEGNR